MPEGHTIHRLARDLRADLAGHKLNASSPQGRFEESANLLDGRRLDDTEAYGKHLFLWWEGGEVVHIHLGLFGKFKRRTSPPPEPVGAVRLRLEGPEKTWDLAGPTICTLGEPAIRDKVVSRLGVDPLRDEDDGGDRFRSRLNKSKVPIGRLLLDQKAVSGIGNVYRAELLFLCGINPEREARELSDDEVDALWRETVSQLKAGVKRNRIVTTDPAEIGKPVSKMKRGDSLYAYKRDECRRCGNQILLTEVANRKLWHCPTCQPR